MARVSSSPRALLALSRRGRAELAALIAALLVPLLALASQASAQSWSSARARPALWQIVAVDRTGEPGFPYGREDVAGDGLVSFDPGEAGTDLRSVYADATADRLWLRTYVASTGEPTASARFFFFIDSDARASSGGDARGEPLEPGLRNDPTRGGYERAIVVRGDGTMLGVWEWSAPTKAWVNLPVVEGAVRVERGRASDPLGIGAPERGYVQVSVAADISRLDASCVGNFFVRSWNAGMRADDFGDEVREQAACRQPNDTLGDPVVLRSYRCSADAECPASGRCRDGVCLFGYACGGGEDCRSGERCSGNQCVRVVDRTCNTYADCDGLVCEATQCAACSESGARACAGGLVCSPSGACVDADDYVPAGGLDNIQGGAFNCAAGGTGGASCALWSLLGVGFALFGRRAWTRMRRSVREGGRS